MIKIRITKTFLIMVFVAGLQFLGTVLLARTLPKADMGLYRLILTVVDLGVMLGLLGMDASLVRFFSPADTVFSRYNWKAFVRSFLPWSVLLMLIVCFAAGTVYRFSPLALAGIIATMVLLLSLSLHSSLLRAAHHYERAVFLSRLHLIVSFALIAALYLFNILTVASALGSYIFAAALAGFIALAHTRAALPSGNTPLPHAVARNGLFYFGIAASLVLISQTGPLLIARVLSLRDLAVFSVIASFMRLFEFVQDSSFYVLTPHLNSAKNTRMRRLFMKLLFAGGVLAALYIVAGRPVVHVVFGGAYDDGVHLIPWFAAVSVVRISSVLPASIIGGLSSEKVLRKQCAVYMAGALVHIPLTYLLLERFGTTGALAAMLITWIFLLSSTLYGTRKYLTQP